MHLRIHVIINLNVVIGISVSINAKRDNAK